MNKTPAPRVLIYDIETSPLIGYTWGIWEQNVIKIKEDWKILTIAWKWLGESKVHVIGQDDFPDYKPGVNNDFMIACKLRELLDEADITMAHNGDQFDIKRVMTRIIVHQIPPPSPTIQMDTKKIFKRLGAFTSNRLKDLAKDLQVHQKGDPGGFETWEGCLAGDPKAWAHMKRYNKQDIPPLEDIYIKVRPYMQNHPAMNLGAGQEEACPKCGEGPMQKRGTIKRAKSTTYQRYQCQACGGWSQSRTAIKTLTKVAYVN